MKDCLRCVVVALRSFWGLWLIFAVVVGLVSSFYPLHFDLFRYFCLFYVPLPYLVEVLGWLFDGE